MILLLLLLVLCGAYPVQAQQKDKVSNARVVTKTGDSYTAYFRAIEDGEERTLGLTEAQHTRLAEPNAPQPDSAGLPQDKTWVFEKAIKNAVYDTPSGHLEPGNVLLKSDEALLIQADDQPVPLDYKTYTIDDNKVKGLSIVPNPPGLEVKDGEFFKERRGQ